MRWLAELIDRLQGSIRPHTPEDAPAQRTRFRCDHGRSARRAAFAYFARGHRPSEVRAWLPVELRTLCLFFRYWKHRSREARNRHLVRVTRADPELMVALADMMGLSFDQVLDAFRARNAMGALNRAIQTELWQLVEAAEAGRSVDTDRAERLFSHYNLVDRPVLRRRLRQASRQRSLPSSGVMQPRAVPVADANMGQPSPRRRPGGRS